MSGSGLCSRSSCTRILLPLLTSVCAVYAQTNLPVVRESIVVTGTTEAISLDEADRSLMLLPARERSALFNTFVDLLKPETAAIAGVLLAIDRETFSKVDFGETFPLLRAAWRGRATTSRLLGGETDPQPTANDPVALRELLGPNLRQALEDTHDTAVRSREDDLLLAAARVPTAPTPFDERVETLGAGDVLAGALGLVKKPEALRRALLDWLREDKTFDVSATTHDGGLFDAMESRVGPEIKFTITGHTHLARALRFKGGGYYFNCGTWIRTLGLTKEVLENERAFSEALWPVLTAHSMDALDVAQIPGTGGQSIPLLRDRTHAVRISQQGAQTVGELLRVVGDDRARVTWQVEDKTAPAVV